MKLATLLVGILTSAVSHSPGPATTDWAKVLGNSPLIANVEQAIAKARAAEAKNDDAAALIAWERVIDRCRASSEQSLDARRRIHELRAKVPAVNKEKQLALPWPSLFVVFDSVDWKWIDKSGKPRGESIQVSESDAKRIALSIEHFGDRVFETTAGVRRVVPTIEHVKAPLKHLTGDVEHGFWTGPGECKLAIDPLIKGRSYESVFVYVKMRHGDARIPAAFWGGTLGGDYGPGGAGYTNICWNADSAPDGEVEFHEWLHQIDWMFDKALGYPDEIVPNPDTGRDEGQEGGDLDFRRPKGDSNWTCFYRHIAEEHITRLMWSEATMRPKSVSPWKR